MIGDLEENEGTKVITVSILGEMLVPLTERRASEFQGDSGHLSVEYTEHEVSEDHSGV